MACSWERRRDRQLAGSRHRPWPSTCTAPTAASTPSPSTHPSPLHPRPAGLSLLLSELRAGVEAVHAAAAAGDAAGMRAPLAPLPSLLRGLGGAARAATTGSRAATALQGLLLDAELAVEVLRDATADQMSAAAAVEVCVEHGAGIALTAPAPRLAAHVASVQAAAAAEDAVHLAREALDAAAECVQAACSGCRLGEQRRAWCA